MIWFLIAAAGLWVLGRRMGAPHNARWLMIALLYIGVLLALLVLPAEAPLRAALGGSFAEWALLTPLAAAVWAYRRGLGWLRRKADHKDPPPEAHSGPMSQTEINRYARHIILREIGGLGQRQLKDARVLVIGAGGLGAPALLYLGAAGIGTIGIIDDDIVDATNLQRQVIHNETTLGLAKVFSAEKTLSALNPFVAIRPYNRRLEAEIADALFSEYDLILDGSDNFATRRLANAAAVASGKPLISGAITQWEGQLTVFDPARGTPCYHCIFPEDPAAGLAPSCAEAGVVGPLPGVIGTMMALEAIKVITGAGQTLTGTMLIYDGLWGETRRIGLARQPDCPICGAGDLPKAKASS